MTIAGLGLSGLDQTGGADAVSSLLRISRGSEGADGTSSALTTAVDSVGVSGPGQLLSKLQQFQSSNPEKFKQVVSDIADKLSQAAQQQGQTREGQFLSRLADKFRSVAQTGDLSQLKPQGPASGAFPGATSAYGQSDPAQGLLSSGQHPATGTHKSHHHHASGTNGVHSLSSLFDELNQEVSQALGTGT